VRKPQSRFDSQLETWFQCTASRAHSAIGECFARIGAVFGQDDQAGIVRSQLFDNAGAPVATAMADISGENLHLNRPGLTYTPARLPSSGSPHTSLSR